jgi:hypothetical protein
VGDDIVFVWVHQERRATWKVLWRFCRQEEFKQEILLSQSFFNCEWEVFDHKQAWKNVLTTTFLVGVAWLQPGMTWKTHFPSYGIYWFNPKGPTRPRTQRVATKSKHTTTTTLPLLADPLQIACHLGINRSRWWNIPAGFSDRYRISEALVSVVGWGLRLARVQGWGNAAIHKAKPTNKWVFCNSLDHMKARTKQVGGTGRNWLGGAGSGLSAIGGLANHE